MTDIAKPPRRTQSSRSTATRERVLKAAIRSLHQRGYAATTTMIVEKEAGVSRGAMLHQFPTRVDLMLAVVRSVYREELVLYREKMFAIDDPRERLLALPEVMWEVLSRPAGVAVLEILQGARSDTELACQLKPLQRRIEKASFAALDVVADAASAPVSPVVKRLIVWAVRGLSVAELLADEPGEMVKSVRLLSRLMALGIEADGADVIPAAPGGIRAKARLKPQDEPLKIAALLAATALASAPPLMAIAAGPQTEAGASGARIWEDRNLSADARARALVEAMTLDEQIVLLRTQPGFGLLSLGSSLPDSIPQSMRLPTPEGALGSAGFIATNPRLGVPAVQMSDASLGVANLGGFLRRGDESTSLPSSLALASSFDLPLAREVGRTLGGEAHAKGFNVQLAGGVNLTREPRNGRNFEYAGEDPLLAGLTVGESIAGIQDRHVVSTLKHYALNSQETGRFVQDARIDEAALRESDLLAAEIAIVRGRPGAVMCAYNRVNGEYACESRFLLGKVLKGEWGYRGWVMSDWGAVHSLKTSLEAGLDQESPQDKPWFGGLKEAVERGEVSSERVADAAFRVVRALIAVGAFDLPAAPGGPIDRDASAAVAERVALEGMVLLKNNGVLPLAASAGRIVVIGGFADRGVLSGGGSSQVMPYGGHFVDKRGRTGLAATFAPVYGLSSPLQALKVLRPDADIVFDDGSDPVRAAALARTADIALVFAVRPETEGVDALDMLLPDGQDDLIAAVAAVNPRTAVVLETGNPTLMPWLPKVGAVLQAWYPGQRGGEAIAKILTGAVSPSGRLPMTFPASTDQLPRPAIPGFDPTQRKDLGLGDKTAPFAFEMTEGADVGYRWFERTGRRPLFAFGHGLTYTRFAYDPARFTGGEGLSVTLTVSNTGARDGVEVVQLYAAPPGRTHRLVGWARVPLKAGERRRVTIAADPRLLASWDGGWRREAGTFDVYVGRVSGAPETRAKVKLDAAAEVARTVEGDAQ